MNKELPYLTSLRGVCAFAVLMAHCTWFPVGGRAVDVFFVLSGYVLTWGQMRRPRGPAAFWLARLVRTAPTHIVATLLVGVAIIAAGSDTPLRLAANLGLLPIFADPHLPINPPTWSLAVEWLCYLAFPVAFTAIVRAPIAALALFGAAMVSHDFFFHWVGWPAVILNGATEFGVGACLAAAGLEPRPVRWLAWIDSAPLRWLGDISFPLYLVQILPLFVLCDGSGINNVNRPGFLRHLFAAIAALSLAAALHLLVEAPARNWFRDAGGRIALAPLWRRAATASWRHAAARDRRSADAPAIPLVATESTPIDLKF